MYKSLTRRQFISYGLRATVLLGASTGYYNTTRHQLELNKVNVRIPNLPSRFKGFKIALLSDFHSSLIVSEGLLSKAASLAMEGKPDMIALTGDFITGTNKVPEDSVEKSKSEKKNKKYIDRCVDALSELRAPMGIYAVLGNHDFWSGQEAVDTICNDFQQHLKVLWLRNKSIRLEKGNEYIDLLGVDDYWETTCSLTKADEGLRNHSVKILLSHNPDINSEIGALGKKIDLVLSGHTHGGQVVLPVIGAPFVPSTMGQKYRIGLVKEANRQTYITSGIGYSFLPLRYNCPPEVALITLS